MYIDFQITSTVVQKIYMKNKGYIFVIQITGVNSLVRGSRMTPK